MFLIADANFSHDVSVKVLLGMSFSLQSSGCINAVGVLAEVSHEMEMGWGQ